MVIRYICACSRKAEATEGVPKTCPQCGAIVTLGALVRGHTPDLDLNAVKKATLRYLGQGADAPMLTPRMITDRQKEVRRALDHFHAAKVADLKPGDLKKFMDTLEIRP